MPELSAGAYARDISVILDLIIERKLVLPQFQRPEVWGWDKQKSLLESLSLGVPTGSYMIWKQTVAPKEEEFRSLNRFPLPSQNEEESEQARQNIEYLLLDGQQRLSLLASIKNLDPGSDGNDLRFINCHIKQHGTRCVVEFSRSTTKSQIDPSEGTFSLHELLQEGDGVDLRFDEFSAESQKPINRIYKGFTTGKVNVEVLHSNLGRGHALYSFDMVNTAGTRLNDLNMAEAKLVNNGPMLYPDLKKALVEFAEPIFPKRTWSGLIDRDVLIKSLLEEIYRTTIPKTAFKRGLDTFKPTYRTGKDYSENSDNPDRTLSKTHIMKSWSRVKKSFEDLRTILEEHSLTNPKHMVPAYLIVAAAYIREKYPTGPTRLGEDLYLTVSERGKIVAWIIRSQIWRHLSGGSTQKLLDAECAIARKSASTGDIDEMYSTYKSKEQTNLIQLTYSDIGLPPEIENEETDVEHLIEGTTFSDGRFMWELLRLLAIQEGARDFLNNHEIGSHSKYSLDHIFPQSLISDMPDKAETATHPSEFWNHPLNIMFLKGTRTNSILGDIPPSEYIEKMIAQDKNHHFIDQFVPIDNPEIILLENYERFLIERGKLILKAANEYLDELDSMED